MEYQWNETTVCSSSSPGSWNDPEEDTLDPEKEMFHSCLNLKLHEPLEWKHKSFAHVNGGKSRECRELLPPFSVEVIVPDILKPGFASEEYAIKASVVYLDPHEPERNPVSKENTYITMRPVEIVKEYYEDVYYPNHFRSTENDRYVAFFHNLQLRFSVKKFHGRLEFELCHNRENLGYTRIESVPCVRSSTAFQTMTSRSEEPAQAFEAFLASEIRKKDDSHDYVKVRGCFSNCSTIRTVVGYVGAQPIQFISLDREGIIFEKEMYQVLIHSVEYQSLLSKLPCFPHITIRTPLRLFSVSIKAKYDEDNLRHCKLLKNDIHLPIPVSEYNFHVFGEGVECCSMEE
eukprot:gb/GECH01014187.1/.p1 GENE.gb/GECH01014187.1/~~gb/GECH01014187.1/.p1  ORF type:complete len:346 (+),score=75.02 gb/GECH01014187.1/:1-1038(+)